MQTEAQMNMVAAWNARSSQSIFDEVAAHLRTQKVASMQSEINPTRQAGCAYRGENGATCAVGCLIPDEAYSRAMESNGVQNLIEGDREFVGLRPEIWGLLLGLQGVHDGAMPQSRDDYNSKLSFWDEFLDSELRRVATRYSLAFTERLSTEETV